MAGGSDWALIQLRDSSRLFQKPPATDWYLQRHYIITIKRKVRGANIDTSPNAVGQQDGGITFAAGRTTKSRSTTGGKGVYVCRESVYERIDESSEYYNQEQVWEWLEPESEAKKL